jgi:molecular chaperone GrpE
LVSEVDSEKLQADLDKALDSWKRTAADFENFRRRKEEENKELVEFAREVTIAKLLPTLDSLEQALKHMPEMNLESGSMNQEFEKQYKNWQTGANGIVSQLDKVLEELGVKKIQALGNKFDPHLHEALREEESEKEAGTVTQEIQTGFELNGKVVRPSQVVISKGNS